MEDIELKAIWNAYDSKIEEAKLLNMQSWAINLRVFETLQKDKATSKLNRLATYKIVAALFGIPWIAVLGILLYGNHFSNIYFSVSIAMILAFTLIAVAFYIRQAVAIRQINYSESITVTQQRLAKLQTSTINSIRFLWLQMPFYTTWFWSNKWMSTDIKFWIITFPVTLLFTFFAIWLYRNISLKNMDKKWCRLFISGIEWTSIMKAMGFLEEIEEFKKDMILK
jgi:hypothetical protein